MKNYKNCWKKLILQKFRARATTHKYKFTIPKTGKKI